MSEVLSSNPVLGGRRRRKQDSATGTVGSSAAKRLKKAQQFMNKLKNVKNATRLITCEFDQQLLQFPGLLGALTPKLESGWQSATVGPEFDQLLHGAASPTMIRPMIPAQSGPHGPVPVSHSFTWTRYEPELCDSQDHHQDSAISAANAEPRSIVLRPITEPEVVLLLNTDQIKGLCKKSNPNKPDELSPLTSFGTRIRQLNRPVTCILFTSAKFRAADRRRSSSSCAAKSSSVPEKLSINELCVRLQISWGIRATRICSTIHDVALVVAGYTRSIAERPYKDGRLECDAGLAFLPDTVRMGLAGCGSRGRGAGPAPANLTGATSQGNQAERAWANHVWLAQLGQWRGLTGEIAHSITLTYPTARAFYQQLACEQHSSSDLSKPLADNAATRSFEGRLAELEIRRGAGLLASRRRLGPEFARRLVVHFTCDDPNHVID